MTIPGKYALAKKDTLYLGYVQGVICPHFGKVEAIQSANRPATEMQVCFFLALVAIIGVSSQLLGVSLSFDKAKKKRKTSKTKLSGL